MTREKDFTYNGKTYSKPVIVDPPAHTPLPWKAVAYKKPYPHYTQVGETMHGFIAAPNGKDCVGRFGKFEDAEKAAIAVNSHSLLMQHAESNATISSEEGLRSMSKEVLVAVLCAIRREAQNAIK